MGTYFFFLLDISLKMKLQYIGMILIGLLVIGSDAAKRMIPHSCYETALRGRHFCPCKNHSDCAEEFVCKTAEGGKYKECVLRASVCVRDDEICESDSDCCTGTGLFCRSISDREGRFVKSTCVRHLVQGNGEAFLSQRSKSKTRQTLI